MKKRPNIVLITIDSLRGDFVNYENMPNLMELIEKQGVAVFDACTAGVPTYYAFPSILGGIYPFKYGVRIGLPKNVKTIAELLYENGYITIGVSAGNVYTSSYAGYDRGFQFFEDYLKIKKPCTARQSFKKSLKKCLRIPGIRNALASLRKKSNILRGKFFPVPGAERVLNDAQKALNNFVEENTSFFLWIHLMDVHEPYLVEGKDLTFKERIFRSKIEPQRAEIWSGLIKYLRESEDKEPEEIIERFIERMKKVSEYNDFLQSLYIKALKSTDRYVTDFIKTIQKKNPNTIFIITSDHGEEFFDIVTYGHFPLFHNDAVVKIPMMMIGLDVKSISIPEMQISTVDIYPTICEIVEISSPEYLDGFSFITSTSKSDRMVYTESLFGYIPSYLHNHVEKVSFIVSAHSKYKKSSTVLDNKLGPLGSYSAFDLKREALQHLKRIKEIEKIQEYRKKLKKLSQHK